MASFITTFITHKNVGDRHFKNVTRLLTGLHFNKNKVSSSLFQPSNISEARTSKNLVTKM